MNSAGILLIGTIGMAASATMGRFLARVGFPLPDKRYRYGCLDGLRDRLALAVMVHHYSFWNGIVFYRQSWELKGEPLLAPKRRSHHDLITLIADRPCHDQRYPIDATKAEIEIGWKALEDFDSGIEKMARWYLDNKAWWTPLRKSYYGERLGVLLS
jgi:hypothetical protein